MLPRAACAGEDPELWFDVHREREAITICEACPERVRCLAWAEEERPRIGVWGGVQFTPPRGRTGVRVFTPESAAQIRQIREQAAGGLSVPVIATEHGVSMHSVRDVIAGRTWPQAGGPIRVIRQRIRKLTSAQVEEMRHASAAGARPVDLARKYGVSESAVHRILNGSTWADAGGPTRPVRQRVRS